MQRVGAGSIVERVVGAAKLDVPTYEAIEHDSNATSQAFIVVVIVAIAAGIGGLADNGVGGLIGGLVGAILGWLIFAVVAYVVGTKLLAGPETDSSVEELLRTTGFAQTPNLLAILAFIPVLGPLALVVGAIWSLITGFIGVRQALDISSGRTVAVILVVFVVYIIAAIVLAAIGLGIGGM